MPALPRPPNRFQIASRGEWVEVTIHYRKDVHKGYHEKGCSAM